MEDNGGALFKALAMENDGTDAAKKEK